MNYYRTHLIKALATSLATTHKSRVEADGGVIPSFSTLVDTIEVLLDNYGVTNYTDFIAKVKVSLDANVYGYKLGTGTAVTLGQACEKLYSINPAADVSQATVANQPLLLLKTTDKYYFSPRISGNQVQTINSQVTAYNNATDTLRVTVKLFMNSQTTTSFDYLFSCGNAGNFAISNRNANKILRFRGSANATDSSTYTPSSTVPHWVRYTVTTTQVSYEWSADGLSWTAIGTVTRPSQGTFSTTQVFGSTAAATQNSVSIYYGLFENITTGKSVSFTPNLYNRAFLGNGWTEADNTLWSIVQANTTTGLKGVLVDENQVIGDGISFKLSNASLAINQAYTVYAIRTRLGTGVLYGLSASSQLSNDGTNSILNNGTALSVANSSRFKAMITAVANGASSSIALDNGTPVTGNAGSNNGTYLDILANGSSYGNFTFNSLYIINGN